MASHLLVTSRCNRRSFMHSVTVTPQLVRVTSKCCRLRLAYSVLDVPTAYVLLEQIPQVDKAPPLQLHSPGIYDEPSWRWRVCIRQTFQNWEISMPLWARLSQRSWKSEDRICRPKPGIRPPGDLPCLLWLVSNSRNAPCSAISPSLYMVKCRTVNVESSYKFCRPFEGVCVHHHGAFEIPIVTYAHASVLVRPMTARTCACCCAYK